MLETDLDELDYQSAVCQREQLGILRYISLKAQRLVERTDDFVSPFPHIVLCTRSDRNWTQEIRDSRQWLCIALYRSTWRVKVKERRRTLWIARGVVRVCGNVAPAGQASSARSQGSLLLPETHPKVKIHSEEILISHTSYDCAAPVFLEVSQRILIVEQSEASPKWFATEVIMTSKSVWTFRTP